MVDPTSVLTLLLIAFVGGAFGAAIGALPALSLAGVVVAIGELHNIAQGYPAAPSADLTVLGASGLTGSVGLAPGLGPHVAFAGGAAAAAFAGRRGFTETTFEYHDAKAIQRPLGARPGALVAGGAFGVLGVLLVTLSVTLRLPWDPIAFSIVVSALLHRIAFGYPLFGAVRGATRLDMTPFERRERRSPLVEEDEISDRHAFSRRYAVEPWLPYQSQWGRLVLLGALVGGFSAFLTYRTASPFLAFGIALAALAFVSLGVRNVPVTYHMALPASFAVVGLAGGATTATGFAAGVTVSTALLVGVSFGIVCALVGELSQRALYAHADTHLDPPAVAIVVGTFLIAVFDVVGVFDQYMLPTLGL